MYKLMVFLLVSASIFVFAEHGAVTEIRELQKSGIITTFQAKQLTVLIADDYFLNTYSYDDEYEGCENLYGDNLVDRLYRITGYKYKSIGYTGARKKIFRTVDNYDGYVNDVYTNRYIKVYNTIPNANDINIEHVWPQSLGATGTAKSDMHHLYPCDNKANSIRGNYPFGNVPDHYIEWSCAGSRYGHSTFEPRDSRKGDIARAVFYFAVRYRKYINDKTETVLKTWHKQDPPDQDEYTRTNRISLYQNNRNPFIIHPDLVDRIGDF